MNLFNEQKGTALVTAISFGLIGTVLVAMVWFIITATNTANIQSRNYNQELETAKGLASLVMAELKAGSEKCDGKGQCRTTCKSGGCSIDVQTQVCTSLGKADCSTIDITYLGSTTKTISDIPATGPKAGTQLEKTIVLEAVTVKSQNEASLSSKTPETAILEFVYATEHVPYGWVKD